MREELEYKSINEEQKHRIDEIKNSLSFAMSDIETNCPPSIERSLALTKVEEAAMWASKAISHEKTLDASPVVPMMKEDK